MIKILLSFSMSLNFLLCFLVIIITLCPCLLKILEISIGCFSTPPICG